MKKIFLVISIVAFSFSLCAEMEMTVNKEKTATQKENERLEGTEKKKKKKAPVQILADEAEFDDKAQEVRYKGNVIVNDNGMKLTCEVMTVYLSKKKEIQRILAKQDVVIVRNVRNKKGEFEKMTAISDEAEYFQKEEKVVLRGNAELERGTEKLRSNVITFYRNSNVVKTGGVDMTFNAETANDASDDKEEKKEAKEEKPAEKTEEKEAVNPLLKKKEEKPRTNWFDDEDED